MDEIRLSNGRLIIDGVVVADEHQTRTMALKMGHKTFADFERVMDGKAPKKDHLWKKANDKRAELDTSEDALERAILRMMKEK